MTALDSIWTAVNFFGGQPMFKYSKLFGENGVWALLKNGAVMGRVYDEDLARTITKALNETRPLTTG